MSLVSRLLGRFWKFPAAITHDIASRAAPHPHARRSRAVGGSLLFRATAAPRAHRTHPKLLRTEHVQTLSRPSSLSAECRLCCKAAAERSDRKGLFRPFFDEQNDGEDTVEWIERQPWFSGKLALWGISYLGNTAWAVAASRAASKVDALGLHVTLTNFRDRTYAFDGFTLMSCAGWTPPWCMILRTGGGNPFASMLGRRKIECAVGARGGRHSRCEKQTA